MGILATNYQINPLGNIDTIHKVVVYKKDIFYTDDIEVSINEDFSNWIETPPGQFIVKHSIKLSKNTLHHPDMDCIIYAVVAELNEKHLCEFYLKWGENGNN